MPSPFFERCKRLFHQSSELSVERAQQITHWKKVLIEEHAELGKELNELLEAYERSLACFAEHAARLDEVSFQRERRSLEEIRQVLANTIRRLEISTKDHQELLNEWNEWRSHPSFTTEKELEETQRIRIEMLRSELSVRGLQREEEPAEKQPVETVKEFERSENVYRPRPELDHLDDWHEMWMQRVEPISRYWTDQMQRLQDEYHPEAWSEIIHQFRAAQAALKIHDRQKGIRRDRLVVFELE